MTFEELEVGDKFIINDGSDIMEKILPEFQSCCHMIANVINLNTGQRYVFPERSMLKVTKV